MYVCVVNESFSEDLLHMHAFMQWEFGFEDMWVLAPTRHGAHNWQGVGQMTAIAAIHHLAYIRYTCMFTKGRVAVH